MDDCMLLRQSSIDGEQYAGDQEYFVDDSDQQEFTEQGMYSMGQSLFPMNILITYNTCACV